MTDEDMSPNKVRYNSNFMSFFHSLVDITCKWYVYRPGNNFFVPFGHMSDSMPFSIGHSYFLSDIKVMKSRVYRLILTNKDEIECNFYL